MKKFTFFLALSFAFFIFQSKATHIQGGEITYRITNPSTRTFEFKLVIYRDITGVDQPNATLNFGDGTKCVTLPVQAPREQIAPETELLTYIFTHSYASDGNYVVSFNEENRNPEIANINDGNSVLISFYIESAIVVNGQPYNNSFKYHEKLFLNARLNVLFSQTITGIDPDGDSLSFQLITPRAFTKGAVDNCSSGSSIPVPNYKFPDDIKINPFSGNITWTPTKVGNHAFAVKVTEYRNKKVIGYTIRDFQVRVKDTKLDKTMTISANAKIKEFNVIDISAEKPLEIIVKYGNSAGASIQLEGYWESLPSDNVSLVITDSADFKIGKFKLTTGVSLIRNNPYIVTFTGTSTPKSVSIPTLKIAYSFILNSKPGKVFSTDPPKNDSTVLGINKEFDKPALVYPNPVKEAFFINSGAFSNAKLVLYNSQGQKVLSESLTKGGLTKVNRLLLPKGIYIYRIVSKGIFKESGRLVFE